MAICLRCSKDTNRTTRNYCQNCYSWLRNHNKIQNLFIPPSPNSFNKEQNEIFIGSMLGDGSLNLPKNGVNANFIIKRKIEDKEYLIWEFEKFKKFCITPPKEYSRFDKRTNKHYPGISFYTRHCPAFTEQYKLWYPEKIKLVPKNLQLTALSILIWFLDDGCVSIGQTGKVQIKFATNGFIKNDVDYLANLLHKRYSQHYGVHLNKNKNNLNENYGFIIQGSGLAALAIINEIDPIFPDFMLRKAKWRSFDGDFVFSKSRKLNPLIDLNYLNKILLSFDERDKITTSNVYDKLISNTDNKRYVIECIFYHLNKYVKNKYLLKIDPGYKKEKQFYITDKGKAYFSQQNSK